MYEQPTNHISLKEGSPICYIKSPTTQDTFRPIPASSAPLEWLGDGDRYLIHKTQHRVLITTKFHHHTGVTTLNKASHLTAFYAW